MSRITTLKLKTVLSLVSTQVDDVTINVSESGWDIHATSPDHVSMFIANIPSTAFEEYSVSEKFGLSVKKTLKALNAFGDITSVTVTDRIILESDGITVRFPMPSELSNAIKAPPLDLPGKCSVKVADMLKASDLAVGYLDAYRLTIDDKGFMLKASDESDNGITLRIPKENCVGISGSASSMFSIDSFSKFLKALPKDAVVDISLGDDMPVRIDVLDDDLDMTYLLAPRIEEE